MFEFIEPRNVDSAWSYNNYLLYSWKGRIGPSDFRRGVVSHALSIVAISLINLFAILFLDLVFYILLGFNFYYFIFYSFFYLTVFLSFFPFFALSYKRLKDIGHDQDSSGVIIFFSFVSSILYFIGFLALGLYCSFKKGEPHTNEHGPVPNIYNFKDRREKLQREAIFSLERNDYFTAIKKYEILKDKKRAKLAKRNHLIFLLNSLEKQSERMADKGITCEDLYSNLEVLRLELNSFNV